MDVDLLNSYYQLEPFHGLKRPVDEDETQSVSTSGEKDKSLYSSAFVKLLMQVLFWRVLQPQ